MKQICYIVLLFFLVACDGENTPNCIQSSGNIVTQEVIVPIFTKILVWEQITLFIEEGATQKVRIETGENLLNDIEVVVVNGQLNVYNNNTCNFVRDYGITKVFVTSPNISEIRSSTGFPISSIGELSYPELTLISENQNVPDITHTDGNFNLTLATETLDIVSNGFAMFKLQGTATKANVYLYSGNTGVEARDLAVEDVFIYHRSSNDIAVNPLQSIRGQIVSFGDVISVNIPPIIEVEELFDGRLIFE